MSLKIKRPNGENGMFDIRYSDEEKLGLGTLLTNEKRASILQIAVHVYVGSRYV